MYRCSAAALLGLIVATAGAAESVTPAEMARLVPPPGLYQIERDSTLAMPQAGLTSREQRNASGDTTLTDTAPDGAATRRLTGAPETICVPPARGPAATVPPVLTSATCKTVSSTASGNSLELVAQCQTGRMATTIERIDASHWNVVTRSEIAATGRAPDLGAMRPLLERMAKDGATDAERAKARALLAQLPQLQAGQQQRLASAGLPGPGGVASTAQPGAMRVDGRVRWTRIADQCTGGRP